LARLKRWNPYLYCADDRAAYQEAIPPGRLHVGKAETHGLERDHGRQRHRLARFRRRTCVVSRSVRMGNASIAHFGGNDKIGDLPSMLG
jgi:insertion element IS1 protein InsB